MSSPTRRTGSGCCARATSGHAAALPSRVMNSRRRMSQSADMFDLQPSVRQSIDLDVGGVDHGCPFLRLCSNERCEVLRRTHFRSSAKLSEDRFHLLSFHNSVNLSIEPANNRCWRPGWRDDARPVGSLQLWQAALGHCRYVRELWITGVVGHRERPQFSRFNMWKHKTDVFEIHLDLPSQQVCDCRGRALVRDMNNVNTCRQLEHLA